MSLFNTDEFKDLQKKWYQILKSTGFEDIEDEDGSLKFSEKKIVWIKKVFKPNTSNYSYSDRFQKARYYDLASQFLQEHTFLNPIHHEIFERHSKGETMREIAKNMKKSTKTINKVIQSCKKEFLFL